MVDALCIYGLPRGNTRNWNRLIDNLIRPNRFDVYAHTWLEPSGGLTHHNTDSKTRTAISNVMRYWVSAQNIELKSFRVDHQRILPYGPVEAPWGPINLSHQINTLNTIIGAFELIQNRSDYENVFFCRLDTKIIRAVNFSNNFREEYDFLHFGSKGNMRFEAEDVLFGVKSKHLDIFKSIRCKHESGYYIRNGIYNIFIHEFNARGLSVKWAGDFGFQIPTIYRPFLKNNTQRLTKKLFFSLK